jgi:hypothetical protein
MLFSGLSEEAQLVLVTWKAHSQLAYTNCKWSIFVDLTEYREFILSSVLNDQYLLIKATKCDTYGWDFLIKL